mmetsp:Transcript_57402/g.135091  ORF Transcript_57402/g.135091 Transcript_57402/m.135091 type:complete len:203 (-) Transcript_57402:201-809(-)
MVLDCLECGCESGNSLVLVYRHGRHDVEGRCDELHLDRHVLRPVLERLAQCPLDRINTLVVKAGQLKVRTDLDGLRGEAPSDVLEQWLQNLRGDLHSSENGCVIGDGDAEGIVGVAKLFVQRPCCLRVQFLQILPASLSDMTHNAVDSLGFVEFLLVQSQIVRGHSPLRQIDVTFLGIDTQNHDNFLPSDTNQLVDGADTAA